MGSPDGKYDTSLARAAGQQPAGQRKLDQESQGRKVNEQPVPQRRPQKEQRSQSAGNCQYAQRARRERRSEKQGSEQDEVESEENDDHVRRGAMKRVECRRRQLQDIAND